MPNRPKPLCLVVGRPVCLFFPLDHVCKSEALALFFVIPKPSLCSGFGRSGRPTRPRRPSSAPTVCRRAVRLGHESEAVSPGVCCFIRIADSGLFDRFALTRHNPMIRFRLQLPTNPPTPTFSSTMDRKGRSMQSISGSTFIARAA